MGFFRQEYYSGLPFPTPEDLPNPGIKPTSLKSPELQANSLPSVPPGKPMFSVSCHIFLMEQDGIHIIKPIMQSIDFFISNAKE